MTGSKYYFTWSIGYATIIIGVICIILNIFLWLFLGDKRGYFITNGSFSSPLNVLTTISFCMIIISIGVCLLYIRHRIFIKQNQLSALNLQHPTSSYKNKPYSLSSAIGAVITWFGIVFYILLMIGITKQAQDPIRYCMLEAEDYKNCLQGRHLYTWVDVEIYTYPGPLAMMIVIPLIFVFIGQMIILIPVWVSLQNKIRNRIIKINLSREHDNKPSL